MPDVLERLQSAVADRYRIERQIAIGGQATVFLAQDLKHPRKHVAIKVLLPELGAEVDHERFRLEIDTISGLTHPHIVPLVDSGTADGLFYYVMPFVEGESLRKRLERERRLPVEDALRIARETAEAADFAHRHGVVHRDLKPENILLEDGHAWVLDFGIARPIVTTVGPRLTRTGLVPGTPIYMSPEQATPGAKVDGRSDQYSLACVLYEMLVGAPPFESQGFEGLVYQKHNTVPGSIRERRPETPAAVARAITRAISRRPEDRFASMAEFVAAISPQPWFAFPRPSRQAAARAVVTVAALVLVGTLVPRYLQRADERFTRVAVTDFRNLTGQGELDYLGAGLSADLLGALVQGPGLVVARGSVADEEGRVLEDPRAIARELGVGLVVTGDIRPVGTQLRLNVQLVDGLRGFVHWGRTFDFAPSHTVELRESLFRELLQRLQPGTRGGRRVPVARVATSDAAFEAYLRGLGELANAEDPLARDRALAAFEDAIRGDSTFALAWAGRARAHWWLYDRDHDPEQLRLASHAADRSVELGTDLLQTRVARARVHRATGQAAEAVAELQRVLRVNPEYDEAHRQLAYAYRKLGDMDRAEASIRQAVALRPESWENWSALGGLRIGAGRYPEARVAYGRVIALKPESNRGYEGVGNALLLEGQYAGAIAAYRRMPHPVTTAATASNVATAYFFARRMEEATKYFLTAVSLDPRNAELRLNLGDCYRRLGRSAEARTQYRMGADLARGALQAAPDDAALGLRLVVAFAKSGECDSANVRLQTWAPRVPPRDADLMLELAKAHALCRRPQDAIATLRVMVGQGVGARRFRDEDEFRSLRDDPGFKQLVAGAGG